MQVFKQGDSSNRQKMHGCFLSFIQQILRQNMSWFLSKKREIFLRIGFISKPTVQKKLLGISIMDLCVRDWHILKWKSSKSILKQIGNEPFTKKGNLPLTIVFFWKFFLGMRTSYK